MTKFVQGFQIFTQLFSFGTNTATHVMTTRSQAAMMQRQQQQMAAQAQRQCLPPGQWTQVQLKDGRIVRVCLPPEEQR